MKANANANVEEQVIQVEEKDGKMSHSNSEAPVVEEPVAAAVVEEEAPKVEEAAPVEEPKVESPAKVEEAAPVEEPKA